MGLALSSYAAPELALEGFGPVCKDRGLDGVELVLEAVADAAALATSLQASTVPVVALRASRLEGAELEAVAQLSASLGVPVSIPASAVSDLPATAARFAAAGGQLLLAVGSNLDAALELLQRLEALPKDQAPRIAWELRPSGESLQDAGAVLFAIREHLALVRLHGGGPEQRDQEGSGVGSILVDLALCGYGGAIVLCPSSPEQLPRWAEWMSSRRLIGCGSKGSTEALELDMREVEPRDRLDTILGTYRGMVRGATLQLTVDHDPSCMYHTLGAMEGEGTFSFRVVESGPEVWRAEVSKL